MLVDFDSVIADLGFAQIASANDRFGTHYTKEDINHWHWWTEDTTPEIAEYVWGKRCFGSLRWTLNVPPMPFAIHAMRKLLAAGNELYVVSDRQPHMDWWLKAYLAEFDLEHVPVIISNSKTLPKIQVARDLGLQIAIDDAPHNVTAFADSALFERVYVLDQPWNRDVVDDRIERVYTWIDFLHAEGFHFGSAA